MAKIKTPTENIIKTLKGKRMLFLENGSCLENGVEEFERILNVPCTIYSNISGRITDVKIEKEDEEFLYYREVYDSHQHAPSQSLPKEGKIRKAEVGFIKY